MQFDQILHMMSVIEFTFDDGGGADYDLKVSSYQYPNDFVAKWIENLKYPPNNETLEIPIVDTCIVSMN